MSAKEESASDLKRLFVKVMAVVAAVPGTMITGGFVPYVKVDGMSMAERSCVTLRLYLASPLHFLG